MGNTNARAEGSNEEMGRQQNGASGRRDGVCSKDMMDPSRAHLRGRGFCSFNVSNQSLVKRVKHRRYFKSVGVKVAGQLPHLPRLVAPFSADQCKGEWGHFIVLTNNAAEQSTRRSLIDSFWLRYVIGDDMIDNQTGKSATSSSGGARNSVRRSPRRDASRCI